MFNIIGADGRQYGPVSADQIRQWIREGRANANTQVQAAGDPDWKTIASVPELADALAALSAPPTMAPPLTGGANRASNKIAAGLCGILLGGLGVHKFILGYTNAGIIMLAGTLGGTVLSIVTCGITFFIPMAIYVIGLVEGIIYLSKSDEEFVRLYVDGRREWF